MIKRKESGKGSSRRMMIFIALIAVAAGLAIAGIAVGVSYLRGIWLEQCRIDDPDVDVVVTTGDMVKPEVVVWHFGLTNGANLAEIDFTFLRTRLLESQPCIRDIKIERRMPNRVTVEVAERTPVARIAGHKNRKESGRVADAECMVFRCYNSSGNLPVIRETAEPVTPPGRRLSGHAAAAMRLVETAALPEFSALRIQEVDTAAPDHLLLTLGTYSRARIAWEHMDEDSRVARESLKRQLERLSKAIALNLAPQTTLWIATDFGTPGRVYASEQGRNGN